MIAVLTTVIATDTNPMLLGATVAYVISRSLNLYIAERARVRHQIGIYSIQQIVGPSIGFLFGLLLIKTVSPAPEWPLLGYAAALSGIGAWLLSKRDIT